MVPPSESRAQHRAVGPAGEAPDPQDLLGWYDRHARDLPWRAPPGSGRRSAPYKVWLSEVMLQQTTVAAVRDYFDRFTRLWPDVRALAAAPREAVLAQWAGLGYYARARNLHACAQEVARLGGFPDTLAGLRALPGVGPYTAAAIAAIAFDRACVPIDGNVERVVSRLFRVEAPSPGARKEIAGRAAGIAPAARHGDFAQALMDLGATLCTPRKPACALCPWRGPCAARAVGDAGTFPRKAPKKPRPTRHGVAFIVMRAGSVLLETRPDSGLLGGMPGPPCSDWTETPAQAAALDATPCAPPCAAAWIEAGEARHVFTHFTLRLRVLAAQAPAGFAPAQRRFVALEPALAQTPTALRKALALGAAALGGVNAG